MIILSLFAVALFANCGGSASAVDGSKKGGKSVRVNLGSFVLPAVNQETDKFFRVNGFEVESREGERIIYIKTKWNNVAAFEDEKNIGFVEVRVRITIEARMGNTISYTQNIQNYKTSFIGDVEVRPSRLENWMSIPNTDMREKYLRKMASDLKNSITFAR